MAVVVIGESLNATIPAICDAVKAHETAYIQKVALEQVEADSDYLDLNAQVTGRDELIDLPWMIESVRADKTAAVDAHKVLPVIFAVCKGQRVFHQ